MTMLRGNVDTQDMGIEREWGYTRRDYGRVAGTEMSQTSNGARFQSGFRSRRRVGEKGQVKIFAAKILVNQFAG